MAQAKRLSCPNNCPITNHKIKFKFDVQILHLWELRIKIKSRYFQSAKRWTHLSIPRLKVQQVYFSKQNPVILTKMSTNNK